MSAYRYLGVTVVGSPSLPPGLNDLAIPAELGRPSEFCLGEVTDVLRWTEIVRARGDTDDDAILMLGGSHGGCVTLRAVERPLMPTDAMMDTPLNGLIQTLFGP